MSSSSLLTVLAGSLVLSAGSFAFAAEEFRGVYMELHGSPKFGVFPLVADKDWRRLARELKALGVNAILPEVVNASGAVYPSQVVATRPPESRQGFPDLLQVILEAAHAEGLEVHPWTIEWSHAPKDTPPERLVHDKDGNTEPFLCPSVEANRALMRDMLLELATRYDVDGVQYDYMRLPGDKYCYCDACRAGFEKLLGEQVADWPTAVSKGGPLEAQYVDYLCDTISRFVEEMKPVLKKAKPNLVISAAVWANNSTARNVGVRQDWGKWVAGGWLDFVAPMNYGNKWIVDRFPEYAEAEAKNVAGRMPLVYGLGAYLDTPEGEVAAVKAGRALNCSGFIIYTLTQETFTKHLPALSRDVWQQPATVPAFGRKAR